MRVEDEVLRNTRLNDDPNVIGAYAFYICVHSRHQANCLHLNSTCTFVAMHDCLSTLYLELRIVFQHCILLFRVLVHVPL